MSKTRHTDESIIQHLRSGDQRQVEVVTRHLLEQYQGLVVRLVQRTSGDMQRDVPAVLDDALAVLVLQVQDGTYQAGRAKLSTYFQALARNILSKRLRQRRSWKEVPDTENGQVASTSTDDTVEKVQAKEIREKVRLAIQQLDPVCQQVLTRFWLKDQSMREISEALDKSIDVIKQRNHRCMKRLRELLAPDFKDWFQKK